MAKAHRRDKIVADKHIDGERLGRLLERFPIFAQTQKPSRTYRGHSAHDEDFAHVLMLSWEHMCPLLTCDGEMLSKALRFPRQYPNEESCLRGVLVLPRDKDEQVRILQRFVAGDIPVIASRKGGIVPTTMDHIETYNIGLDLRQDNPRVVELCDCEE